MSCEFSVHMFLFNFLNYKVLINEQHAISKMSPMVIFFIYHTSSRNNIGT